MQVGVMHVSAKTCSVFVELTLAGGPALHALTFNDEGLVSSSRLFSRTSV